MGSRIQPRGQSNCRIHRRRPENDQQPRNVKLKIVTDSKLVIGWLSEGFKRNDPTIAALCAEIDTLRAGCSGQWTASSSFIECMQFLSTGLAELP